MKGDEPMRWDEEGPLVCVCKAPDVERVWFGMGRQCRRCLRIVVGRRE